MTAQTHEFRVRWRREGLQGTSRIYQTEKAARAKADRLMALDAIVEAAGHGWLDSDPPKLVAPPIVDTRPVGVWEALSEQATEPTDEACAGMEEWLMPGSQSGVAMGDIF